MYWIGFLLIALTLLNIPVKVDVPSHSFADLIVELDEGMVGRLETLGHVRMVMSGIATLRVSRHLIDDVVGIVRAVYSPRRFTPSLEVSTAEIGLPEIMEMKGLNTAGIDGSNVLIAIIDTGVDYNHPAFKDSEGRSRILYIWDQTLEGKPPKSFDYGYECSPEEINSGGCPERDVNGHGTLVASIAAGSSGVARSASLIVVKAGGPVCDGRFWSFDEAGLLDALAYVHEKAVELGMRLVINLSLGTDIGGHDGNSPLEKVLDSLVEQGVVVVVAAGNSAADGRHVKLHTSAEAPVGIRFNIPDQTSEYSISLVTQPDEGLGLTLVSPGGEKLEIGLNRTENWKAYEVSTESYKRGSIWEGLLTVTGPVEGLWRLEVSENSLDSRLLHLWLESDTCSSLRESFTAGVGYEISQESTVSIPGTASKVITVGAYMTRNRWVTESGRTVGVDGVVGSLEYYSGRGPTIDGRVKPDVTAPGGVIIGAKSRDMGGVSIDPSGLERPGRGTSMATPHVAGVAALILQISPTTTAEHVAYVIQKTARQDNFTGSIGSAGSNAWGWGKLNAVIAYPLIIQITGYTPSTLSLSVNGTSTPLSSGRAEIILLKNTLYELRPVFTGDGVDVRYRVEPEKYYVSSAGEVIFSVSAQYHVNVFGGDGELLYSGWVPSKTVLDLENLSGLGAGQGFHLVRRSVAGYYVDGSFFLERRVLVDRPANIYIVVAEDYTGLLLVAVISAVIPVSIYLGWVYARYRRNRW
ncbi:Serine protease AprX [archaeon HR01]|nr:Serine protease AprX [archaeon HR01]